MKVAVALLLGVACFVQAMHTPTQTAEKQQLIYQKNIFELLWHVDQPNVFQPQYARTAETFKFEDIIDSYTDKTAVTEYMQLIKNGLLPRGELFSTTDPKHQKEATSLFKVLYYAKDLETLYNVATWARSNVNEIMFIYTMVVTALHNQETKNLPYPEIQELIPQLYFNEDVLHKAHQISMGNTKAGTKKTVDSTNIFTITVEDNAWGVINEKSPEQKIDYYTQDVGMNAHYFMMSHEFPFWMGTTEFNMSKNIRGELYLFQHKQLLNRYALERLSNDLGEIDYINLNEPITTGYYPLMHHYNGIPFPQRPANTKIPNKAFKDVQELHDTKTRISGVIDKGFVVTEKGERINIYNQEGLNILGNIIQGNADSVNVKYYGQMDKQYKKIVSQASSVTCKDGGIVPTALDIISTNLRDPAFYQISKTILTNLVKYKENLPAYKHEELLYPGVKIESVTTDELTTYFEHFDTLVTNAVAVDYHEDDGSKLIMACQMRLKHKPFDFQLTVNSDKDTKATARIFLGPKQDVNGKQLDLHQNYNDYLQLDQWTVDLKTGTNVIKRNCKENAFGVPDKTTNAYVTYKKLMKAINGAESLDYTPHIAGFPERIMLPKGKKNGMPFKLFVSITEFDDTKAVEIPMQVWGPKVLDGKAMGYPLDRPVDIDTFKAIPNFLHKEVVIYHKEELNITS